MVSEKPSKSKDRKEAKNLFPGIVHELIICTTEYFPVTREGGMWDDEIARRITISVSYLGVTDAGAISRSGLGANK